MRTRTASAVVALLLAGGLTVRGISNVRAPLAGLAERAGRVAGGHLAGAVAVLRGGVHDEAAEHGTGPTCALVLTGDLIVGVDREGYVTLREKTYSGDLAAVTGFRAPANGVGERVTSPEVLLGLSVVKAFDKSADLSQLLSEVNVADLENPRAVLCGGPTVDMGTGDYEIKLERLRQILKQTPELGIRPLRVDMRFGVQVVVEFEEVEKQARKEV